MDEHHQHDNGRDGAARVQEFASDAPGSDAKEPRQDRDQGSVGTFEAKAEEIGKNAEAKARAQGKEPRQRRDQGRVGTFETKAEDLGRKAEGLGRKVRTFSDGGEVIAGGHYVYAWQRQVADFYGMRLRKNFEFGRRFAAAGDIADVVGLQCEYVRDTLLDYASSVYQMAGFGLRGARHTAERLDRPE
jgi:hypothetical protein